MFLSSKVKSSPNSHLVDCCENYINLDSRKFRVYERDGVAVGRRLFTEECMTFSGNAWENDVTGMCLSTRKV